MHILLLDDAPGATPVDALRRALEPARLIRVEDEIDGEAAAILLVPHPDDPPTVARRVAAGRAGWPELPLVVWIPSVDVPAVVAAMRAGADDVVAGPPDHVGPAIRAAVPRGTSHRLQSSLRLATDEPFRSMATPLYRSRRDGVLADANPAFADLLGFAATHELIGTDMRALYVDPADRRRWTELLETEGTVRGFEARLRRRDEGTVWVRETARVVDGLGDARYEGSLEDISPRVAAEAALEASRRQLETLLAHLPGMAYRCLDDVARTIELVSDGAWGLVGAAPNTLAGDPDRGWTTFIHPEDRLAVTDQLRAAVDGQRSFQLQYRIVTVGGAERWVAETGRAVDDDHLEGFVTDVTDRWYAEQQVRDSEVWYRTLFESSTDGILLLDRDGNVIDGNPRIATLLDRPLDHLIGAHPAEFGAADQPLEGSSRELIDRAVAAALRGQPRPFELRFVRPDGRTVDTEVELTRVHAAGHDFLQAIVRDVTGRNLAAAALARRERMLAAVSFAAARFLHEPEWERLAGDVLAQIGSAAFAHRAALFERRTSNGDATTVALRHLWSADAAAAPLPDELDPRALGLGRWADAIAAGQAFVGSVADMPAAECSAMATLGAASVAVVPVLAGGEVWGALVIDDTRADRSWTDGEIEAVRAAADILGGAVWLERARQAVAARSEALELLNHVNALLASRADVIEVLQEIADLIRARCGLDHVSFALPVETPRWLRFVAWSGADATTRTAGLDRDGPGLIAAAARRRHPVYAADVEHHPDYLPGDASIRSEYAVPLVDGDELLGVLNGESRTIDGIGPWHRDLIDRLAAQAAVAVRRDTRRDPS